MKYVSSDYCKYADISSLLQRKIGISSYVVYCDIDNTGIEKIKILSHEIESKSS